MRAVEIAYGTSRNRTGEGVRDVIFAGEVLSIAQRTASVNVEVLHFFCGLEFLALILRHHANPCQHDIVVSGHLVSFRTVRIGRPDHFVDVSKLIRRFADCR